MEQPKPGVRARPREEHDAGHRWDARKRETEWTVKEVAHFRINWGDAPAGGAEHHPADRYAEHLQADGDRTSDPPERQAGHPGD